MKGDLTGKLAFYVSGNELRLCKICSYDTIRGKYRILPKKAGGLPVLRKKDLVYPIDELFNKYKRFIKEM